MENIQAIITGDIVKSTQVKREQYSQLTTALKTSFQEISSLYSKSQHRTAFDIFRGDSFQGLISNPVWALEATLIIRSHLRKSQTNDASFNWDARIAIGIGAVDYEVNSISEGTGQAYEDSGKSLDQMNKEQRLAIVTPWQDINDEMQSQTALLDAIINKWSVQQAEIVFELLQGNSRKAIGKKFNISQAAIHYRIKGAGWFGIEKFITRYQQVIQKASTND